MGTKPDGLYIDGKPVPYKGKLKMKMGTPDRLVPPIGLREGSTAEAWKHGRLVGCFVSRHGLAVDPMEMLTDASTTSGSTQAIQR